MLILPSEHTVMKFRSCFLWKFTINFFGFSPILCRMLVWLMYWVAGYLFNRIDIQNRHIHMLKAAQEVSKGYYIIFKRIQSFSLRLVSSLSLLPLSLSLSLLPSPLSEASPLSSFPATRATWTTS